MGPPSISTLTGAYFLITIILVKKNILPASIIFILQIIIGATGLHFALGSCDGVGIGLDCSGNTDLGPLALIAFLAIPPVLGKLISDALHKSISWKRALALHLGIITLIALIAILWSIMHSSQ